MTEVIEHLVSPDRTLTEIRRILDPKGHLILSTPNLACLPNRLLLPLGIQPLFSEVSEVGVYGRRLRFLGQGGKPVGHLRLYTKHALVEQLAASGFRPIEIRGAAYHDAGALMQAERIIGSIPALAMILVVCAQVSQDGAGAANPINS
jgi:2-polyprenyl-3-methyl-5-hydroxy-6-metoxy-1,4-benzoquinol methylase